MKMVRRDKKPITFQLILFRFFFLYNQPYVDFFTGEKILHPLSNAPEPKSRHIPSKWEHKRVRCMGQRGSHCKCLKTSFWHVWATSLNTTCSPPSVPPAFVSQQSGGSNLPSCVNWRKASEIITDSYIIMQIE